MEGSRKHTIINNQQSQEIRGARLMVPAIINGAAHWIVTDTDSYYFDDSTPTNEIKFFKTTDGVNVENYKTILLSQINQTQVKVLPDLMKIGSKIYIKAKYAYIQMSHHW